MRTIPLEQVDQRIADALKQQRRDDPILLTRGSDALGLLLPLPEGTKDSDVDGIFCWEGPMGHLVVVVEAGHVLPLAEAATPVQPVFGNCKGMLTVESEDEEHLKDFEEYMQ